MNARVFRASLTAAAGAMLVIAPAVFSPSEALSQNTSQEVVARLADRVGTSLGPPGGEVRSLVAAPTRPERLYLGTSHGHLYRTDDSGERWHDTLLALGHEAVIDNLLVHPDDADVLFAAYWVPDGTGGLVQTRDGGVSWERLQLGGTPSLRALAIAPSDSQVLYAGGIGGVWRSTDGGTSWFNVNGKGLATDFIESLAVDPRDPSHVYAGTWRQVYRSRNGGETWTRIYEGMALDRDVFSLVISPHDPDLVFAGTCNYLYCSRNAGGSWGERRSGLAAAHNRIHTILYDPRDPAVVYAGTRGALYRSNDGGTRWEVVLGGVSVSALTFGAGDTMFIATEERGVLRGHPATGFDERNEGLFAARITAFDSLPGSPRVLFAARADGPTDATLLYSTDLGESWRPLGTFGDVTAVRAQRQPLNRVLVAGRSSWSSVTPSSRDAVAAPPGLTATLEIDHRAGGTVLAATSEGLFRAAPEALVGADGEARPFDAEAGPWTPIWTGGPVRTLAVGDGRFVAWSDGIAIAGAVAGGEVSVARPDLDGKAIIDVALDPADPRRAYAISRSQVFRSGDGGASWSGLELPWSAAELRAVAIDPATPDQVLVLDYRGALYRGHDAGRHWLILDDDPGLHRAWGLRTSPEAPGWALVGTQGHGLRAVGLSPLAAPAATGHD